MYNASNFFYPGNKVFLQPIALIPIAYVQHVFMKDQICIYQQFKDSFELHLMVEQVLQEELQITGF